MGRRGHTDGDTSLRDGERSEEVKHQSERLGPSCLRLNPAEEDNKDQSRNQ